MADRRRRVPDMLRPGGATLPDPGAQPAAVMPAAVSAGVQRLRDGWRAWMLLPLLLLALAMAAVVPSGADLVHPEQVVGVRDHVDVTLPDGRTPATFTGEFLVPARTRSASLLQRAVALLPGGAAAAESGAPAVDGFDPVERALLMGSGIAPGRSEFSQVGITAVVDDGRFSLAELGLALELYEQAAPLDLAAGRRILVIGVQREDTSITCGAEVAATVAATSPAPDLVMIGNECPAPQVEMPVMRIANLTDAAVKLSQR